MANDTSGTHNPGCQGTVHCLISGLEDAGYEVMSRIAIGYGYPLFQNLLEEIRPNDLLGKLAFRLDHSRRLKKLGSWIFGASKAPQYRVSFSAWNISVSKTERELALLKGDTEWLVVNGEGTIHDNTIGALTLLGLCKAARQLGMKVAIVNCSIFNLDSVLLDELKLLDYIAVREPLSFSYLRAHGIKVHQAADCLFLAKGHPVSEVGLKNISINEQEKYVVYTPGVLAGSRHFDKEKMLDEIKSITAEGYTVYYYVVEREDEKYIPEVERAGAKVIDVGTISWQELHGFLGRSQFVVSGRYHIVIFSILAGVPFFSKRTNTEKIDGLLELLGISLNSKFAAKPDVDWSELSAQGPYIIDQLKINECSSLAKKCCELLPYNQ
ncbi:MAG: polysaccharide pyruvyl transferase family protein [Halioglobus sp.]